MYTQDLTLAHLGIFIVFDIFYNFTAFTNFIYSIRI